MRNRSVKLFESSKILITLEKDRAMYRLKRTNKESNVTATEVFYDKKQARKAFVSLVEGELYL